MSPLLQQLIDALKCLPGVGPKSAQRMAFYLLERDTDGAKNSFGCTDRGGRKDWPLLYVSDLE